LLLSADAPAARPQLSINISCLQGTQQQTHRPPLLLLIDEADGCPLAHLAPHTAQAVSTIQRLLNLTASVQCLTLSVG